jgi:hypothetical protein
MKRIYALLCLAWAAAACGDIAYFDPLPIPDDYFGPENLARVTIKEGYGIEQVFDLVNSTDLDIDVIHSGGYTAAMSWGEMQMMLVDIRSKSYISTRRGMGTYWSKGEALFSVSMTDIEDPDNQADWLRTMTRYSIAHGPQSSHNVNVRLGDGSEDDLKRALQGFDIVDNVEKIDVGALDESRIETVDSKILIRPVETCTTQPRTLQLHCQTERSYSTISNSIVAVKQQSDETVDISFNGVYMSPWGFAAIGPATTVIDLGALAQGVYTLNLYGGGVRSRGRLVVTAGSYSFEMANGPTFGFTDPVLHRIPLQTIWGYVSYMSDTFPNAPAQFFKDIEAIGAEKVSLEPGWYREFEIGADGLVIQPAPDNPNHPRRRRLFVYRYTGDQMKIADLVEQWGRDHGGNNYVDVAVYSDRGTEFLSWMYDR